VLSTGVCCLLAATALSGASPPLTVSPGNLSKLVLIADPCPTFSWGRVDRAKEYELVVYRLGQQEEQAQPVLRQSFAGLVDSWTPSLDRCLERGAQYAWSVRAVGSKEASDWSAASLFEVSAGPSEADFEEALQVVRQYLGEEATANASVSTGIWEPSSSRVSAPLQAPLADASAGPPPLLVPGGEPALQVNGAPVVTTATLSAAIGARMCLALDEYRYIDLGDGTVRDCNTGRIWLRARSRPTPEGVAAVSLRRHARGGSSSPGDRDWRTFLP
jgi:hypothetical protein